MSRTHASLQPVTTLAAVSVLMAGAAAVHGPAALDQALPEGFRAIIYHVDANPNTVVYLQYWMECPPADACASHAYVVDPNPNQWWRHLANRNNGNISVYASTPVGSIAVPILQYDHEPNGAGVIVDWPVEEEGDFYFIAVTTHPARIEVEDITDADAIHISTSEEATWFKASELPAIAAARIGHPGVAAGSIIEWTAKEGAYAFSLPFPNHPAGYLRTGPAGQYLCHPLELNWCRDSFWGPPGDYKMIIGAIADPWDMYFTGYVDMRIP